MKIFPNMQSLLYNVQQRTTNIENSPEINQTKNAKNFDEILIHQENTMSENQFVKELAAKLKKEVYQPKSTKDLEELKLQVENGTYSLALDEVARRILYWRKGGLNFCGRIDDHIARNQSLFAGSYRGGTKKIWGNIEK